MLGLHTRIEGLKQGWKERLGCSAPGCHGRRVWDRVSEGTGSVQLHGRRYCFPLCFERELRRRLHHLELPAVPAQRPVHRVPLGLLMLSRGDLNTEQLRRALAAHKQDGSRRIGEWIQKLGFACEQQITAALGAQWSCPVMRNLPQVTAACAIPFHLLRLLRMAPVHFNTTTRVLYIAFARDIEFRALVAIERMLDCKAEPCLAGATAVESWLDFNEGQPRGNDHIFENVRGPEEITRITSSYATRFSAEDTRIARCGDYIWIRMETATDFANLLLRSNAQAVAQEKPPFTTARL